jgi:hypothetical protein
MTNSAPASRSTARSCSSAPPATSPSGSGAGPPTSSTSTPAPRLRKLVPADGEQFDWFGTAVAIDTAYLVVGAINDDDAGGNAGAAYVYETATGNPVVKLLAPDGSASDAFGSAVAVEGTTALVASPLDDPPTNLGGVYVFDLPAGTLRFKLVPTDNLSDKQFGFSVAVDGNTAVIGAPRDREASASGVDVVGAAYLYDLTTGALIDKLLPPDGEPFDHFGTSVDIEGGLVIVGSPRHNGAAFFAGAAYLFDASTGDLLGKIDGNAPFIASGTSVAIDADASPPLAAVGAIDDDGIANDAGAVFVYSLADPTVPVELDTLRPASLASSDALGTAVAIDGGLVAGGAPGDNTLGFDAGAVYAMSVGPRPCNPADLADPRGTLDLADITAFVTGFTMHDPIADLHPDGLFDLADITAFVGAFTAGCP